jgi:hypothetical protein
MAGLMTPAAFLAIDQLDRGLWPGEKTIWIALFGVPLAALVTLGDNIGCLTFSGRPVGLFTAVLLLGVILGRALRVSARDEPGSKLAPVDR